MVGLACHRIIYYFEQRDLRGSQMPKCKQTLDELVELFGCQRLSQDSGRKLSLGQRMKDGRVQPLFTRPRFYFFR